MRAVEESLDNMDIFLDFASYYLFGDLFFVYLGFDIRADVRMGGWIPNCDIYHGRMYGKGGWVIPIVT